MRIQRAIGLSILSAALVGGTVYAVTSKRESESRDAIDEARGWLVPSFGAAPTLERIDASRALTLLDQARGTELERDDDVQGWKSYAQALESLQRGDLVQAEGALAAASSRLGEAPQLLVLAASLSFKRFLFDQAKAEIERALESDSSGQADTQRAHLLAALIELALTHPERAKVHLEQLRFERVAIVWTTLGLTHEALREWREAGAAYRRAVELDAEDHDAWVNLGRMLRMEGDCAAAVSAFDEAIELAHPSAAAHLGRGLCRMANHVAGADDDFRRAIELAPNDAEPHLALGDWYREQGELERAIEEYRVALRIESADAASWVKLGNSLVVAGGRQQDGSGYWIQAVEAYREAISRAPELSAAYNGLGAALLQLAEYQAAREALDRAAELDPNDPNPWMNLARVHDGAGDPGAAELARRRAEVIRNRARAPHGLDPQ